jgi:hypothetical protein
MSEKQWSWYIQKKTLKDRTARRYIRTVKPDLPHNVYHYYICGFEYPDIEDWT